MVLWGNDDSLPLIIHDQRKAEKGFSYNEENGKGEMFFRIFI
ncbi:conserved hypothetical protein [Geobacillus kaustophilus GBlys]|uniref:Uncharacterized protein n=1 Tax=Geobacillus kaustophilus GBlys TaxID=1337888 RepID=U2X361_GEOKU|nr:conserved hypothetical protein [Geobacillus kaustophilus GBlys]